MRLVCGWVRVDGGGLVVVRAGRGATQLEHIALHNLLQTQPEWTSIQAQQRDEAPAVRKQARELENKVTGRLVDEADVVCACVSSEGKAAPFPEWALEGILATNDGAGTVAVG